MAGMTCQKKGPRGSFWADSYFCSAAIWSFLQCRQLRLEFLLDFKDLRKRYFQKICNHICFITFLQIFLDQVYSLHSVQFFLQFAFFLTRENNAPNLFVDTHCTSHLRLQKFLVLAWVNDNILYFRRLYEKSLPKEAPIVTGSEVPAGFQEPAKAGRA